VVPPPIPFDSRIRLTGKGVGRISEAMLDWLFANPPGLVAALLAGAGWSRASHWKTKATRAESHVRDLRAALADNGTYEEMNRKLFGGTDQRPPIQGTTEPARTTVGRTLMATSPITQEFSE